MPTVEQRFDTVVQAKPTCANCRHCSYAALLFAHLCRRPGGQTRKVAPSGRCEEWRERHAAR